MAEPATRIPWWLTIDLAVIDVGDPDRIGFWMGVL
jgi:hypothetical protein